MLQLVRKTMRQVTEPFFNKCHKGSGKSSVEYSPPGYNSALGSMRWCMSVPGPVVVKWWSIRSNSKEQGSPGERSPSLHKLVRRKHSQR